MRKYTKHLIVSATLLIGLTIGSITAEKGWAAFYINDLSNLAQAVHDGYVTVTQAGAATFASLSLGSGAFTTTGGITAGDLTATDDGVIGDELHVRNDLFVGWKSGGTIFSEDGFFSRLLFAAAVTSGAAYHSSVKTNTIDLNTSIANSDSGEWVYVNDGLYGSGSVMAATSLIAPRAFISNMLDAYRVYAGVVTGTVIVDAKGTIVNSEGTERVVVDDSLTVNGNTQFWGFLTGRLAQFDIGLFANTVTAANGWFSSNLQAAALDATYIHNAGVFSGWNIFANEATITTINTTDVIAADDVISYDSLRAESAFIPYAATYRLTAADATATVSLDIAKTAAFDANKKGANAVEGAAGDIARVALPGFRALGSDTGTLHGGFCTAPGQVFLANVVNGGEMDIFVCPGAGTAPVNITD